MNAGEHRRYGAGDSVEDLCRVCKLVREHSVIAADPDGSPLRVVCGFCGSQHNFRGGDRPVPALADQPTPAAGPSSPVPARERNAATVSEQESASPSHDLDRLIRRIIREEAGLATVVPAEKWRGGELVLRPGKPGLQEKSWPIETFFRKIVAVRDRLRVLEQQVNSSELAEDVKIRLQAYITACYGSLTSFNVLFASDEDRFRGTGGS